jgi:three-Cys-motif partner protein
VTDAQEFFCRKKPWSKYKDLILDYYLEPYLAKVAKLRRPIIIVDCFAGPGSFDDGQLGSPLIIAKRLTSVQEQGAQVMGFFIEKDPVLYERLDANTRSTAIPVRARSGDFHQYISEIAELARSSTVFVYLDPIKPSDLRFSDMECVYRQLQSGRSVETLINFMSTGFLRAVRGQSDKILIENTVQSEDRFVLEWDAVAGGTYWHDILFGGPTPEADRVEQLAKGYAQQLHQWFKWVLNYPIRENYSDELPKYHLTFGSRHPDAIELMNRAMVKARREFVEAEFVDGYLFPNEPDKEIVNPAEIQSVVLSASLKAGKTTWKDLRVLATITLPCKYTDSDFDKAIKKAIQGQRLGSTCSGSKIDELALVWPIA